MDRSEHLPHENQEEADGHNGTNDTENDSHDVDNDRAFLGLLHPDLEFTSIVSVAVHKSEPTIVVIQESAADLLVNDLVLNLFNYNWSEWTFVALIDTILVLGYQIHVIKRIFGGLQMQKGG